VWHRFFCPPGCGRIERPAFPAPSLSRANVSGKPRPKTCGEIAKLYLLFEN
jgi:hypothetical protein